MLDFVYSWPTALQILAFIVALVVGVFCLVKFCDIFVDSASAIAKKLHVSSLIIGLTIVAIGTSCPELAVSVSDSITSLINGGNANVAIGNVVGSNICNLLIVLGISAVFTPMIVRKSITRREYPFLLGVSLLTVIFGIFFGLNGELVSNFAITRWEGIILVVLIFVYIAFLIYNAKKHPEDQEVEEEDEEKPLMATWKAILFVILGAAGVALGGELVVFGAKGLSLEIATAAGFNRDLSEALVGLTVVAVGTSLPELFTSAIAAKKGENELALGNVIGSNIFNMVFVLGIASTVNPLTTGSQVVVDLIVMMVVTIVVFVMCLTGKISKKYGWILLAMYLAYVTYLIIRTVTSVA